MINTKHSDSLVYFGYGASQPNRLLRALMPDYVVIDDRKLHDLLAFVTHYAKHLRYFDKLNRPVSDFQHFVIQDISVFLALVVSTDVEKIENEFTELLNSYYSATSEKERKNAFINICNSIYGLIEMVDRWYIHIRKLNIQMGKIENIVESELHNIIVEKLREQVQFFKIYMVGALEAAVFTKSEIEYDFDSLQSVWHLEEVNGVNIFKGATVSDQLNSAILKIRMIYRQVFHAVNYTIHNFGKYFNRSLDEKHNHQPHIGLLITFLKLFRYAQEDLNEITSRILYFYYHTVLQQNQRDGICDHVNVCFLLAEHVTRTTLEKGTLLSAGPSVDGTDITYETTQEVEITRAKIKALKSVFVSRLDEVDTSEYQIVTAMYAAPIANSYDGQGGVFDYTYQDWPLFGEEQEFKPSDTSNMQVAEMGFAIASPMFYLREGEREVSIKLTFDKKSTKPLKKLITNIRNKENEFKEFQDQISYEEVFYTRIFNQGDKKRNVKIFVTGAKGWIQLDPEKIILQAKGAGDWLSDATKPIEETLSILDTLQINFRILNSVPAIVPFNDAVYTEAYQTDFPVIKIVLDDSKQPYSYTFLQHLKISSVAIDVKVDKVRNVDFHNDYGMLDGRNPFYPFGFQPKIGDSFLIGCSEINRKQLKSLSVNIEWKDLPENTTEFKKYYAEYGLGLTPEKFKVGFAALVNGNFEPATISEDDWMDLFPYTGRQDDSIEQSTFLLDEVAIKDLGIKPDYYISSNNPYDHSTQSGYLRMELTAPKVAFGHEVFSEVFTKNLLEGMKDPEAAENQPKQPYTPIIKNLTLGYSAHTEFDVLYNSDSEVPEKIFHVHPFGVVNTYKFGSSSDEYLLPSYEDEGHLYIGLEEVNAPESLSILFQLSSKNIATHRNIPDLPKIRWSYLNRSEKWVYLTDIQMLSDSTEGFTKSGIVTISLPKDISNKCNMIERGLYWVRVTIDANTNVLCSSIGVYAQAVQAVRQEKYLEEFKEALAPYTISQLVDTRTEFQTVYQPFESYFGRRIESKLDYFARVSERLRHKHRAISHWDYERIVLESFSDVHQAKCLSSLSNPIEELELKEKLFINIEEEEAYIQGIQNKEGVLLVVVPKPTKYYHNNTPNFNLKMLQQIEDYLKRFTSPFVTLKVRNPIYEYVRVIANIKFSGENIQTGLLLKQLQTDIQKFITPWFFDSTIPIAIGGYINENTIKDYIKSLPYIKFVTKFSLLHIIEEDGIFKVQDTSEEVEFVPIVQARPWGILIADDDHEIEVVHREEEEAPERRVNSETVIRFQNRVNILGGQKYVKIRNPFMKRPKKGGQSDTEYSITFKI